MQELHVELIYAMHGSRLSSPGCQLRGNDRFNPMFCGMQARCGGFKATERLLRSAVKPEVTTHALYRQCARDRNQIWHVDVVVCETLTTRTCHTPSALLVMQLGHVNCCVQLFSRALVQFQFHACSKRHMLLTLPCWFQQGESHALGIVPLQEASPSAGAGAGGESPSYQVCTHGPASLPLPDQALCTLS